MPDFIDQTTEREEALLAARIKAARTPERKLAPVGQCHWCSEPLHNSAQLFCDGDCATDFDKYNR